MCHATEVTGSIDSLQAVQGTCTLIWRAKQQCLCLIIEHVLPIAAYCMQAWAQRCSKQEHAIVLAEYLCSCLNKGAPPPTSSTLLSRLRTMRDDVWPLNQQGQQDYRLTSWLADSARLQHTHRTLPGMHPPAKLEDLITLLPVQTNTAPASVAAAQRESFKNEPISATQAVCSAAHAAPDSVPLGDVAHEVPEPATAAPKAAPEAAAAAESSVGRIDQRRHQQPDSSLPVVDMSGAKAVLHVRTQ